MHKVKDLLVSRPLYMAMALILVLLALVAVLGAVAQVRGVTDKAPEWIEADYDGDGRDELIFTANLAVVVFNDLGEIVGWYPKAQPGSDLITKRVTEDGVEYDFARLKNSVNLLRGEGRKALQVVLPENEAPVTGAVRTSVAELNEGADDRDTFAPIFRYQQGDVTVTKKVTVNPRQFKVDAAIDVDGVENYVVNFDGLGNADNPDVKAVERGDDDIESTGEVEDIQYAALQQPYGVLSAATYSYSSTALIVKPLGDTRADVVLEDGKDAQLALQLSGDAALSVYGGRNELIHLYQEGFYGLPGLFDANIWGTLSLQVAKLMEWLYSFLGSWFLVIVAITVLIRLAIWPLMQSQARYTARMQFVQPEVVKINEKYKDDPQKRAEATMALYREHNVNPAGCLPIFIQFPFLIVLWGTIRNFEFDSGFLWLPDLSIPDPTYILAVLYVAVNLLSLWVSTRKMPQMFKQQAFLYLFFAYFALTFPAGVTMYWILSAFFTVGQQLMINRQMEVAMAARNVERVEAPRAVGPVKTKTLPKGKRQKE